MNPLMEWISHNVLLTFIILAVIVAGLWRHRFIAIGGVILFLVLAKYANQFHTMNQRATATENTYVSCLHRELCARSAQHCAVCNGVSLDNKENCLMAQVNMSGLDTSNEILAVCLQYHQKSYLRNTLENIWDAIKPF